MSILGRALTIGVVAAAALTISSPTRAGMDISFGATAPIGNDGQLFFSISSRYFDRALPVVDTWGQRFPNPDDLAVFLYICSHSRTSPEVVFSYRKQGMGWFAIGTRVGVPVDAWYVPVRTDPGPPYGKAYGYWRKHKKDPHYAVRLNDRQCRDLVAVRMAHDYYGVSPQVAMDWRRSGSNVSVIMSREYRSRHSGGSSRSSGRDDHQDDDDHGQGNGHGRHNDHGNKHGDGDGKHRND